ncbi:hypothetical protein [uncultured Prevotella sp.]|uniref:hypothetical protein n=1 Tax=uncultured Prevotella sp. TaxID=159272 RepID=UPI0025F68E36|nr:hypothetical protein [uncultured Prevotella sp.]
MKVKKIYLVLCAILVLSCYYIYYNVPLRTAIFRSFIKGNWYILSEKDTLYSFGYYGVKKWLVNGNNDLVLMANNDDFCNNTKIGYLIGRSGVINGNYIYVAARSYLGGDEIANTKGYINGRLLILKKSDLSIVREISSDIKLIEAKKYKNYLIVSGLKGFNIYRIIRSDSLNLIYKYREKAYTEFQGLTVIDKDSCSYIAFARFAEGISIWNITDLKHIYEIKKINISELVDNNSPLKGLQCFDVEYKAPYLYASLAPLKNTFQKKEDKRGIIVCDISDINQIKQKLYLIPKRDWYFKKIGDPSPSYIDIYDNNLYVNFGEKGVAKFDIANPESIKYNGIINISKNKLIQPIHINYKGILFAGDYYWPTIYTVNLNK